jgi:hypothetical protein
MLLIEFQIYLQFTLANPRAGMTIITIKGQPMPGKIIFLKHITKFKKLKYNNIGSSPD